MKNLKIQAAWAEQTRNSCKGKWRPSPDMSPDKKAPDRDSGPEHPTPLFNRPQLKGLTGKCFGCGQVSHYQADCPHMNCTWVKSLRGIQVGHTPPRPQGCFTLLVTLNGTQIEALIETGCRRTLIRKAREPFTPKVLRIKCIHRDVREYRTKWADIGIGLLTFKCRISVVPWLDYRVLIGWDCPILPQLLSKRRPHPSQTPSGRYRPNHWGWNSPFIGKR